jgi:hypothetical protein
MTSTQEICLVLIASESAAPLILTISEAVQAYALLVRITPFQTSIAAVAVPSFRTERRSGESLPVEQPSLLLVEFSSDLVICVLPCEMVDLIRLHHEPRSWRGYGQHSASRGVPLTTTERAQAAVPFNILQKRD